MGGWGGIGSCRILKVAVVKLGRPPTLSYPSSENSWSPSKTSTPAWLTFTSNYGTNQSTWINVGHSDHIMRQQSDFTLYNLIPLSYLMHITQVTTFDILLRKFSILYIQLLKLIQLFTNHTGLHWKFSVRHPRVDWNEAPLSHSSNSVL